jgi:hypothetical protein
MRGRGRPCESTQHLSVPHSALTHGGRVRAYRLAVRLARAGAVVDLCCPWHSQLRLHPVAGSRASRAGALQKILPRHDEKETQDKALETGSSPCDDGEHDEGAGQTGDEGEIGVGADGEAAEQADWQFQIGGTDQDLGASTARRAASTTPVEQIRMIVASTSSGAFFMGLLVGRLCFP